MSGLERVLYRSRALVPTRSLLNLAEILAVSQRNNLRDDITGVLAVGDDAFVQVLEGNADSVRTLMNRIVQDPRHDRVHILGQAPITERLFTGWSMISSRLEPTLEGPLGSTMMSQLDDPAAETIRAMVGLVAAQRRLDASCQG